MYNRNTTQPPPATMPASPPPARCSRCRPSGEFTPQSAGIGVKLRTTKTHNSRANPPGHAATFTVIPAPPNRHSGASRNLGRVVTFNVITACAGIQGVQSRSPPFQLPQPSFRRKPESSAALREPSLRRRGPQPSFRRKPESRECGHIRRHSSSPNRHSGASRNPCLPAPLPTPSTVIPAQAGI